MAEENLVACAAKKKRRYSSYEGETSAAPPNLLLDERGKHHFRADSPNETWITDVTEFRIPPQGLSLANRRLFRRNAAELVDLHVSDAEMANSSLLGACEWLDEGRPPGRAFG